MLTRHIFLLLLAALLMLTACNVEQAAPNNSARQRSWLCWLPLRQRQLKIDEKGILM